MQVKDVMTTKMKIIHPDAAIKDAADEMKNFDVGALPVIENDKPVGMLTDRDITVRVVSEGNDPAKTTVKNAMTAEVYTVYEDQDVQELTNVMKEKQIRRVVVTDRNDKVTGICSLGDLATATEIKTGGDVLRKVSQPGS